MCYLGIDYHKRYSFVTVLDEEGKRLFHGKVLNTKEAFMRLLEGLPEPRKAVIETSRTWGVIYDLLENLGVQVLLAHALRLRAIAEAQIKTDKRDSEILAYLLKANLIPSVHVPDRPTRLLRNLVRERLSLVKIKTRIKNRVYHTLDRNHVPDIGLSDVFGKTGRAYIESLSLPPIEMLLLRKLLLHLDFVELQVKELESAIGKNLKDHPLLGCLTSIPGIGNVLGSLIAVEIDQIKRFPDAKRFASYAGLVPSTYASGGVSYQGRLLKSSNRFLKWAFIEAAWVAQARSPYFRAYFEKIKSRLGIHSAIVAVARRMAHIAYTLLKDNRTYQERFSPSRPQYSAGL